jgi:hypothetical protein
VKIENEKQAALKTTSFCFVGAIYVSWVLFYVGLFYVRTFFFFRTGTGAQCPIFEEIWPEVGLVLCTTRAWIKYHAALALTYTALPLPSSL